MALRQWNYAAAKVCANQSSQIIEGCGSSFLGFFTWFIMPDWPSTTKFLSSDERVLAVQRLAYDGLSSTAGAQGHISHWAAFKMAACDWRTWVFTVLYMLTQGAQTIQYFVPTLIGTCMSLFTYRDSGHNG